MQNITPQELKQRLENASPPELIDVREAWEYDICRIEGSKNIPMSEIVTSHNEMNKQSETVVLCHHGGRSLQVAGFMESIGFENVMNLEGGIDLWAKTVDPDMPQY